MHYFFHNIIIIFLNYFFSGIYCIRINLLDVPSAATTGTEVRLLCDYDLERQGLYQIKWYNKEAMLYKSPHPGIAPRTPSNHIIEHRHIYDTMIFANKNMVHNHI